MSQDVESQLESDMNGLEERSPLVLATVGFAFPIVTPTFNESLLVVHVLTVDGSILQRRPYLGIWIAV